MADNTTVVMLGLGVGVDNTTLLGTYDSETGVSVRLDEPARMGKLIDIVKRYVGSVDGWPDFLKKALDLDANFRELDYQTKKLGTAKGTTLSKEAFTGDDGQAGSGFPESLAGATIEGQDGTFQVKKSGQALADYIVTESGTAGEYVIKANIYKVVVWAQYEKPLALVEGLISIKFLAFGVTNDPRLGSEEFAKLCAPAIKALPSGT
jgi:hypothetical protein